MGLLFSVHILPFWVKRRKQDRSKARWPIASVPPTLRQNAPTNFSDLEKQILKSPKLLKRLQNIIDGNKVIINKPDVDQNVDETTFEVNEVYVIDIVMSTGEGKPKELTNRTTVFKRAVDRAYSLKLQAARTVFSEIQQKFPALAFTLRALDEKKRRLGIVEILKHDLLDTYPVLWEKDGEFVVQFKFTAMILPNSTERLSSFPLPHVTSDFSVDSSPELKAILAMSTKRKKKPKKKKKQGGAAAATPGTADAAATAGQEEEGDDDDEE